MPITQIPFQDPVAPPEKQPPEQLGLYDSRGWETAYRELDDDARVPHLLIQLQDDLTRARRREAAWISIIVHLILIFCIINFEWLEKHIPWMHSMVVAVRSNPLDGKSVTFLELPPDLQKAPPKPSNIISDKNRVATTRHPELDSKELRKALATPPPGRQGLNGPPIPQQQQPAQPAPNIAQNQPQVQPQNRPQPPPPSETAQLHIPAKPSAADEFKKYMTPSSVGSQINDAARATAGARGGQAGDGGDYGLGTGAHGRQVGNLEILSDTMGVDFGPYLQRVLHDVRQNWYNAIPESAQMKHGNLILEFAITKDGKVAGLKQVTTTGDIPLDRAAWAGIMASDPFPPLPTEFGGEYLALRFRFYYNPTKDELDQ
ncbi:MAG TPA: TonB C-terminal domain-containing protein [Candidatus Binatia bacterium]|nr:TonB C-terminal domain-containing protein [Candidatus Binatia bacterium]